MNKVERTQVVQDIQKILTLLIDENNWCKKALAEDSKGNALFSPTSDLACKWCLYGAMYALDVSPFTFTYLKSMCLYIGYNDLDRFNDQSKHYQIIQFLQFALNNLGGWFQLIKPLYYRKLKKVTA